MIKTWKQFKEQVEQLGVTDNHQLNTIDVYYDEDDEETADSMEIEWDRKGKAIIR